MPSKRERLEQELLEKAHQAIRKMLDSLPTVENLDMSDMEQATGEMGHELMRETMQQLSETQQPESAPKVDCANCETRMHKRGKRKKRVMTVRGEVEVERQYYVCPSCGTGHFPP